MVDPVSLAVVSGASMVSMLLGRFSKNSDQVEENPVTRTHGKLQFVNLAGPVDPIQFIPDIQNGNSIFINIRSLFQQAENLSEFLYNLEITAKKYNLALKQISSELLLLTKQTQLIKSKSVSQPANRDRSSNSISSKDIEVMAS
ncbi:MAG: hypothetical protein ACXAC2_20985 [Candidatus Kariarchaeaceae archaeon]